MTKPFFLNAYDKAYVHNLDLLLFEKDNALVI